MQRLLIIALTLVTATGLAGGFLKRGQSQGNEKHEGGACPEKREAKHQARKLMHDCIEAWGKENAKPNDADPTDDCSLKLASFVQASKDLKSCRISAKPEASSKPTAPAKIEKIE